MSLLENFKNSGSVALATVLATCYLVPSLTLAKTSSDPSLPPTAEEAGITLPPGASTEPAKTEYLFIREFKVQGAKSVPRTEVEKAVYPFLGPYRTPDDVEKARAALEKVYQANGFQAATVQIPEQKVRKGVISLQVQEGTIGRVRVRDSRYFDLDQVKQSAPSLVEGKPVNVNELNKDIATLNQWADRRVTPALKLGTKPNTVDIDLTVKDSPPLAANVELNNRRSPDTSELRLNGGASYNNLWQLGHTLGASFQLAPENPSETNVFSGYYLAPVPNAGWLRLMMQGTKNDSNVSTLGGSAVSGAGYNFGPKAIIILPGKKDFYHSFTAGFDYKVYDQELTTAGVATLTPINYFPFNGTYSAGWSGEGYETNLTGGLTLNFRGTGSSEIEFDNSRFGADSNFFHFRGDVSHQRDLPGELQFFVRVSGQASGDALISTEQASGGGLDTVRGYLESEATGDNAAFGSFELRSPSMGKWLGKDVTDWRFFVFTDAGVLTLNDSLPGQTEKFELASIGAGTRVKIYDRYAGYFQIGSPLLDGPQSDAQSLLLMFSLSAEF
jgi:hemolysin activation/secretion protein